jgi:hypothetical protein
MQAAHLMHYVIDQLLLTNIVQINAAIVADF